MRQIVARFVLCALLAVLAGCSATTLETRPMPSAIADLPTKPVDMSEYRGKVVYVDFWASWCAPCRGAFQWMFKMQEKYGAAGLAVVAVNLDTNVLQARRFLQEYPANFDIVYDTSAAMASKYMVRKLPSSFLYDREGRLVEQHVGFHESNALALEQKIEQLLKETSGETQ